MRKTAFLYIERSRNVQKSEKSIIFEYNIEFLSKKNLHYDYVRTCVGTGGTLAGIAASLFGTKTKLLGFSVLKNGYFLYQEVFDLLQKAGIKLSQPFELVLDYHFGGYGKHKPALLEFIKNFSSDTKLPIEPVYTGKLFFGVSASTKLNRRLYFCKNLKNKIFSKY